MAGTPDDETLRDAERLDELPLDSDVDVEAMEGFAVLRAAALAGVPAVEVRVISNEIAEPDRSKWRFDHALDVLAQVLPPIVARLQA